MKRRRLPSLNSLKSFEAVARNKSFTLAADELCVTQGAVSHQVKSLEVQLGERLFERDRSRVILTQSGEVLLKATNAALNKVASAIDELSMGAEAKRKTIYIQASSQFSQFWLVPRIREFLGNHSGARICVGQSPPETDSASDTEFISILPNHADADPEDQEFVFRSDLTPMCSTSLTDSTDRPQPREALRNGFLLCERKHDWWDDWSEMHPSGPDIGAGRLYFEDASLAVHTALAGQGWVLGSRVVLDGLINAGQLVSPLDPGHALPRAFFMKSYSSAGKGSLVRKFRSWLLDNTSYLRA